MRPISAKRLLTSVTPRTEPAARSSANFAPSNLHLLRLRKQLLHSLKGNVVPKAMRKSSLLHFAAGIGSAMSGKIATAGFCTLTSNSARTTSNYVALEEKLKEIDKLAGIDALLGWDQMTMLPSGSSTARNNQKSALASIIYEKKTSPEMKSLVTELIESDLSVLPSDFERAVVRDAAIILHLAISQTKDMTVRQAELDGRGYQIWAGKEEDETYRVNRRQSMMTIHHG